MAQCSLVSKEKNSFSFLFSCISWAFESVLRFTAPMEWDSVSRCQSACVSYSYVCQRMFIYVSICLLISAYLSIYVDIFTCGSTWIEVYTCMWGRDYRFARRHVYAKDLPPSIARWFVGVACRASCDYRRPACSENQNAISWWHSARYQWS